MRMLACAEASTEENPAPEGIDWAVYFDTDGVTSFHEAYVALNAIYSFVGEEAVSSYRNKGVKGGSEKLKAATERLTDERGDALVGTIQKVIKDKTQDGQLAPSIGVWATSGQMSFLHHCLARYEDTAVETAVHIRAMGAPDGQAYGRTMEAVMAVRMRAVIEAAIDIPAIETQEPPLGFR